MCKLHHVSYGLKQAPRAWHDGINTYILFQGFVNNVNQDTNLYYLKTKNKILILVLYVDDLFIINDHR
jgi:hypothetical protein